MRLILREVNIERVKEMGDKKKRSEIVWPLARNAKKR